MNGDSRRQARIWLALVFLVGIAVGGVFGYGFARKSYASAGDPAAAMASEPERRAKRVADMTKDIGLTAEQSQKLDAILLAAHSEMKTIHDKSESDIDGVRQKARAATREFLTDEQKPRYEEFVKKLDEERKKMMAGQK
jgi:hypothetical protein